MDEEYVQGENIYMDFLTSLLNNDYNFSDDEENGNVVDYILDLLEYRGVKEEDLEYVDFKIISNDSIKFTVVPENIITALWLSEIYPPNCNLTYQKNSYIWNGKEYNFDKKNKKLIVKNLKNG